jgi:hypothetical protein
MHRLLASLPLVKLLLRVPFLATADRTIGVSHRKLHTLAFRLAARQTPIKEQSLLRLFHQLLRLAGSP